MVGKKPVVVGIGELLWDMLPGGKRAGGAPVNFVYHAARLGAEGYAISAIGEDVNGIEILEELDRSQVKYLVQKTSFPTGTVEVKLQNGIPSYLIVENTAWDNIPLTEEAVALVRRADAVCFGTLALRSQKSRQTILALLAEVPEQALRFFDINLRSSYYSRELITELLEIANVFKINEDEIKIVRQMFDLRGNHDDVCQKLRQKFQLKYLIYTAGEKYSEVFTPTEKSFLETPCVPVVDTVGAGDAFSGAFIYSLLTGKSLQEAHKRAVEIAAYVVTKAGAWPEYDGSVV